jgi:hypothetical protein
MSNKNGGAGLKFWNRMFSLAGYEKRTSLENPQTPYIA